MTTKRKTCTSPSAIDPPQPNAVAVINAEDIIYEASSLLEAICMAAAALPETCQIDAIQTTANLAIDKLTKAEDILDKYRAALAKAEVA